MCVLCLSCSAGRSVVGAGTIVYEGTFGQERDGSRLPIRALVYLLYVLSFLVRMALSFIALQFTSLYVVGCANLFRCSNVLVCCCGQRSRCLLR
jgi:hypothetical protein